MKGRFVNALDVSFCRWLTSWTNGLALLGPTADIKGIIFKSVWRFAQYLTYVLRGTAGEREPHKL